MSDDLGFLPLAELAKGLRQGTFSAVDLARLFLDRLDGRGRTLGAVAALDGEGAMALARASDDRRRRGASLGALDGIPFAVKDSLATRPPLPTSWGAVAFRDRQLDVDAEVVGRLKASGAVLLGKLAMMEMSAMFPFEALDGSATGFARNPFDPGRWTGDSSSGPAAAVGGGLVPFALAGETRGSIIQPAAFCGAVGLRPSHGLVPLEGAMLISESIDRIGPIAHTPGDCLAVLRAIANAVPEAPAPDRPRIGFIRPAEAGHDAAVLRNFEASLRSLAGVSDLTEVALPPIPFAEAYGDVATNEARRNFRGFVEAGLTSTLVAPEGRGASYLTEPFDGAALERGLAARPGLGAALLAWAEGFDAFVTPTIPRVAPLLSVRFGDYFREGDHEPATTLGAILGLPAITVPDGADADGLPTGLQCFGRVGADRLLCEVMDRFAGAHGPGPVPVWA